MLFLSIIFLSRLYHLLLRGTDTKRWWLSFCCMDGSLTWEVEYNLRDGLHGISLLTLDVARWSEAAGSRSPHNPPHRPTWSLTVATAHARWGTSGTRSSWDVGSRFLPSGQDDRYKFDFCACISECLWSDVMDRNTIASIVRINGH